MDQLTDEDRPAAVIELDRRLSTAAGRGKGIKLDAAELDLLISLGAIAVVANAKAEALAALADERAKAKAARPSAAPISAERVDAAYRRVQRVLRTGRSARRDG